MNAHATLAADPAPRDLYDPLPEATVRARAVAEAQLAVLGRLAEAGLQVALAVEHEARALTQASAPGAACEPCEPSHRAARTSARGLAMAYARAARAVRMTVLLQSRVLRELESVERQAAFTAPAARAQREAARQAALDAGKARVARIVRRVAQAQDGEDLEQEAGAAVRLDGIERLDDDVYGDVLTRPMGEIVARICADLGLEPDWCALASEAWAQAEQLAGDPRSPFNALGRAVGAQDNSTTKDTKSTKAPPRAWRPSCPS